MKLADILKSLYSYFSLKEEDLKGIHFERLRNNHNNKKSYGISWKH
jgi:hypothetical protein